MDVSHHRCYQQRDAVCIWKRVPVTCEETLPCSLSWRRFRSGTLWDTTSSNSETRILISSMATSIGLSSSSLWYTTRIRFLTYGNEWDATRVNGNQLDARRTNRNQTVREQTRMKEMLQEETFWFLDARFKILSTSGGKMDWVLDLWDLNLGHFPSVLNSLAPQPRTNSVLTSQYGPSFELLVHLSSRFPVFGERRLVHKATQVIVSFEVRLAFLVLLGVEVWRHVGNLDVRLPGV